MLAEDIARTLSLLFPPGAVIEVRAITEEGIASGYFNEPAALVAAAGPLDASGTQGIYVTLNEVNPALLSRRANRIKMRLSKKDATTADTDIIRRRWFPIDIDPVRPSGVSSSDEEHQAALDRAERIAAFLSARGWPIPVRADSGNGAHLLYRIDLPNDDGSRDLVKRALEALDLLFSDGTCTVDSANHNAARIWKLYGTTSRKGDHTPDRPHRAGRIISAPGTVQVVSRDLLEALASALPVQQSLKDVPVRRKAIDLRSWLIEHGIGIASEKLYQGGTLYVLDECPFSGEHRDGAFAIQFGNGAVFAGCHHSSCGGGSQRWQELRAKFEQRDMQRVPARTSSTTARTPAGSGTGASPPITPDELPGREEALAVLQHGDPKQAMLRTFGLDHEGDEVVAECLIMSLASRSVLNTNGLHVSVTGESGKGKSHAFATMLRQVPDRFRLEGAMSNKALFYLEGMQPGSVIVLDDTSLSEEVQEILKSATTNFCEPIEYRTVTKDRTVRVCTIPERCVWWVAKVEGSGDDQVQNRMLTCWIDDSPEQDARVLARILARNRALPDPSGGERPEVLACQAMWEIIGQHRFHVVVPFAPRIRFQAAANRRNPEMLFDLVKANTVLRFLQREQKQHGSVPCLVATPEDFTGAARLYALLNGTAGGQETKLTRREAGLLDAILRGEWPEFTIPMLQRATGWSNGDIYKIIHGYKSRGTVYSGLLEKCPAISYCDRTVVTDDEAGGVSMRRRTNAYQFDRDLYRTWCAGGAVWLDTNNETDPDDGDPILPQTAATAAYCCKTAATAAGFNSPANRMDSQNTDNNNNYLSVPLDCCKSTITEQPQHGDDPASSSLCDAAVAAGQRPKTDNQPPIDTAGDQSPPITLLQMQQSCSRIAGAAAGYTKVPVEAGRSGTIDAREYKLLETPIRSPCHVCGAEWSFYSEKFRPEHAIRPPFRLCKRCYEEARRKTRERVSILPGTVDLSRVEPLKNDVGRCGVCNLEKATHIDRAAGVKLCEACYHRLMREEGREGVAG